jgi:hypothetical protein
VTDPALRDEPERLARDLAIGALIEGANGAYRAGLDEGAAFTRLTERLEARPRALTWLSLSWQWVTLGAALSFSAGVVLMLQLVPVPPSPVAFGPELSPGRRSGGEPTSMPPVAGTLAGEDAVPRAESALEIGPVVDEASSASPELDEPEPARQARRGEVAPREADAPHEKVVQQQGPLRGDGAREPRPELIRELRAPKSTLSPRSDGEPRAEPPLVGSIDTQADTARIDHAPTSVARTVDNRTDCLHMARQGEPRAAEQCFSERAAGTGLGAEMALYEMARLRRDVLRDGNGALRALDDYRQRFPHGSLRHEVSITRVELLSDLGRSREALNESAALLGSASGQERAAELHLLRGNIFRRDLKDIASAVVEYAKAESLGGVLAAESTRLRGMSLEAMGDVEGALAAYRRYLAADGAPRKAEVTRRVEALVAAATREAAPAGGDGADSPKR